ncbi:MAG TPA: DNA polymerase III subunit chi [Eoetvoesiella sp.]
MARIDFAFGAPERLRMACEVVRKHYLSGRRIVVYTQNTQLLARFDRLLWGFDATAFIPHVDATDPLASQTPVLLTSNAPVPPAANTEGNTSSLHVEAAAGLSKAPWLVNLDTNCPPNIQSFERVLEIVSNDPDDTTAARERWRQYKTEGHTLHAHDVSSRPLASSRAD